MFDFKNFEKNYLEATGAMKDAMKKDFIANFPTSVSEARNNPTFECGEFLDLVTGHEELAHKAKFKALMLDIFVIKETDPTFFITEAAGRIWKSFIFNPD